MSEFIAFAELGIRHIADVRGADHILFLMALAAIYRPRDWRDVLRVVTSFTIGHSIALALAVTGAIALPASLIEFLIPVTIVATCVENIVVRDRRTAPWNGRYRPVVAGAFGLVHGAGFANYLTSLFVEQLAIPLAGFNLGLEIGQLAVLAVIALVLMALDRFIGLLRRPPMWSSVLQVRVLVVSSLVAVVAGHWAYLRAPW